MKSTHKILVTLCGIIILPAPALAAPTRPDISWASGSGSGLAVYDDADVLWSRQVSATGHASDPAPVQLGGIYWDKGKVGRVASNGKGFFVVYEVVELDPCSTGANKNWIGGLWYESGAQVAELRVACPGYSATAEPLRISPNHGEQAAVAYDVKNDEFLVVWVEKGATQEIKGRRFTSPSPGSGPPQPLGSVLQLTNPPSLPGNANTNPRSPTVAGGPGRFVVGWINAEGPVIGSGCTSSGNCLENQYCDSSDNKCHLWPSSIWTNAVDNTGLIGIAHFVQGSQDATYDNPTFAYTKDGNDERWLLAYDKLPLTGGSYNIWGLCMGPGEGVGGFQFTPIDIVSIAGFTTMNERFPSISLSRADETESVITWSQKSLTQSGTYEHVAQKFVHAECGMVDSVRTISAVTACTEDQARATFDGTDVIFARHDLCTSTEDVVSAQWRASGTVDSLQDVLSN